MSNTWHSYCYIYRQQGQQVRKGRSNGNNRYISDTVCNNSILGNERIIMHNSKSQKKMILQRLINRGRINKRESEQLFGCERLAARIDELRRDGWYIKTCRQKVINRYGQECYVADYVLEKLGDRQIPERTAI